MLSTPLVIRSTELFNHSFPEGYILILLFFSGTDPCLNHSQDDGRLQSIHFHCACGMNTPKNLWKTKEMRVLCVCVVCCLLCVCVCVYVWQGRAGQGKAGEERRGTYGNNTEKFKKTRLRRKQEEAGHMVKIT